MTREGERGKVLQKASYRAPARCEQMMALSAAVYVETNFYLGLLMCTACVGGALSARVGESRGFQLYFRHVC
jgi:hypothetical protein